MILLFDIGNTNTHVGLADAQRVLRTLDIPTKDWQSGRATTKLNRFVARTKLQGVAICSVVPWATPVLSSIVSRLYGIQALVLSPKTLRGVGIDYPKPKSIGADRLANSVAARKHFGAPVVVVDFGTAVTFDVVDARGNYVGGIIAPGLAAMTEYLHERTALLPRIRIREVQSPIGRSTEEAMLVGAVHGYRGLVCELIKQLKQELKCRRLPVVATGGYADLIAARLSNITAVSDSLTLEGLRLVWLAHQ